MLSLADLVLADWMDELRPALDEATPERGTAFAARATEHLADDPVVLFAGEYNAGKSSLVKRLLLECEAQVPQELFVDASPATDRPYEARASGWRLRDTPGLDAKIEGRSAADSDAIGFSEVVVITLLASLFSEDSELGQLVTILGRELAPPGAIVIVLTQADRAAGTSGGERYDRWYNAKSQEVRELLARCGLADVPVFVVTADARGAVGNREVTATAYERTRAWDGVDRLRRSLLGTPCPAQLRRAAILRAAAQEVDDACQILRGVIRESKRAMTASQGDIDRMVDALDRLQRFDRGSRKNLRDHLTGVAATGPSASATARILGAAERWSAEQAQRLERYALEWKVDADAWKFDVRAVVDSSFIPQIESDDPAGIDLDLAVEAIKANLTPLAGDADTAKQLNTDLKRWREAERQNRTADYYKENGGFDSLAEVKDAERELEASSDGRRFSMALRRRWISCVRSEISAGRHDRATRQSVPRASGLRHMPLL